MNNADLIAALKRLLHGQRLTPAEASEIKALVDQNTISALERCLEQFFGKA